MKYRFYLLFFTLSLFLISCSTNRFNITNITHAKKIKLVSDEFKRWQEFQIEGIAEVQYKMFVLRKNFVLQKNTKALRFDLLDSGVFGLSGNNLSIYADSCLQIDGLWGRTTLDIKAPKQYQELYTWANNVKMEDLDGYLGQLSEKNEFVKDSIRFVFNQDMRLKKIEIENLDSHIDFNYDFNNTLTEIFFYFGKLKICNLKIDKITYNNINVSKLK